MEDLPGWTLDLYGPCHYAGTGDRPAPSSRLLASLGNRLRWHGAIPRSAVAAAIDGADVAIVPNRPELSDGQSSMKLFDVAARGRPAVVSAGVTCAGPERPPGTYVAEAPGEWAPAILAAADESGRLATERINWAWSNTWEQRWPAGRRPSSARPSTCRRWPDGRRRLGLMLTDAVAPDKLGGLERYVRELSAALVAKGLGVTVVTKQVKEEDPLDEEGTDGVHIVRQPVPSKDRLTFALQYPTAVGLGTVRHVRRLGPGCVVHGHYAITTLPVGLTRRPYLYTFHAPVHKEMLSERGGSYALPGPSSRWPSVPCAPPNGWSSHGRAGPWSCPSSCAPS